MLTIGKMIFAACFVVVFVAAMIWSYKKDSFTNKIHFKGASKVLVIAILVLFLLFIYVKMRHKI
jgi:hypothetical protein